MVSKYHRKDLHCNRSRNSLRGDKSPISTFLAPKMTIKILMIKLNLEMCEIKNQQSRIFSIDYVPGFI